MISESEPKIRLVEVKKKSPAFLPAVGVVDSASPQIDAVRISFENGALTVPQMMKNIFESQGVSYFNPGEKSMLPEITDERLKELGFPESLVPLFKGLLNDTRRFYYSQPMVDRYSFEQGDSDIERRIWQNFACTRYGKKTIQEEYDLSNQLSSNLLGKLQYTVDLASRFIDQEKHKDLATLNKQIKKDLIDALLDYNQLPLDEKLAVVLFFEEQAKLFFDLLAGVKNPTEVLRKRREGNNKPDENNNSQLVGAKE